MARSCHGKDIVAAFDGCDLCNNHIPALLDNLRLQRNIASGGKLADQLPRERHTAHYYCDDILSGTFGILEMDHHRS
jgi:hypothetical protein